MNKIIHLAIFSILFSACSFHDSGGFWSKEQDIKKDAIKFILISKKKKKKL